MALSCATSADELLQIGQPGGREEGCLQLVPVITAFGVECALKALSAKRSGGKYKQSHDLVKLYDELPDDLQRTAELKLRDQGTESLRNILEQHRKAFENWRYPPTDTDSRLFYSSKLRDVLCALIRTLDAT